MRIVAKTAGVGAIAHEPLTVNVAHAVVAMAGEKSLHQSRKTVSMPQDDRQYYTDQFARLHDRLDEIGGDVMQIRLNCEKRHANDCAVAHMLAGNGKPALAVRLDRLEQAEPRKDKAVSFWVSVAAMGVAITAVVVDWWHK